MIITLIGTILLSASGVAVAISVNRFHKRRLATLDGLISLIFFIKGQVDCYARPVCEILTSMPPEILLHCNCNTGVASLEEIAEIIPGGVSPEEALNEKELARIIDSFVREQANDAKLIFIARYWSYKSVSEISRELGFSQSKVKTSLHRVRTELKEKLEKEGYGI